MHLSLSTKLKPDTDVDKWVR